MATPVHDLLASEPRVDRPARGQGGGTALCLSGGGYRAMVFHAGALQRLDELGYLPRLDVVSSVSGGSITAGVLALAWPRLQFDAAGRAGNLEELVVDPVRAMAARTVDVGAVLGGALPRRRASDGVVRAYRRHLFRGATLQDLPDRPNFVFCATNLETTSLVRLSKEGVADYRLGVARSVPVPLAAAVAASSAFPPFLSPVHVEVPPGAWDPARPARLPGASRRRLALTDGGVYDNLGLEPVIKRCSQVLVSDGGGGVSHPSTTPSDWVRHLVRATTIIDSQVRALRKRMLVESYRRGDLTGTYWGIRTALADYGLPDPLPFPEGLAQELAQLQTRLRALGPRTEDLLRWGRTVSDAAMRRWVLTGAGAAAPVPAGAP